MQWEKKQKRGTPKGAYFAPEEALSPVFGGHVSRPWWSSGRSRCSFIRWLACGPASRHQPPCHF